MPPEQDYDPQWPLRRAIEVLLVASLPADVRVLIPGLIDEVTERSDVAPHANKRWGELSEGEGNIVAREVGLVAARVMTAAKLAPRRLQ
jgi:hypothetical protein